MKLWMRLSSTSILSSSVITKPTRRSELSRSPFNPVSRLRRAGLGSGFASRPSCASPAQTLRRSAESSRSPADGCILSSR